MSPSWLLLPQGFQERKENWFTCFSFITFYLALLSIQPLSNILSACFHTSIVLWDQETVIELVQWFSRYGCLYFNYLDQETFIELVQWFSRYGYLYFNYFEAPFILVLCGLRCVAGAKSVEEIAHSKCISLRGSDVLSLNYLCLKIYKSRFNG